MVVSLVFGKKYARTQVGTVAMDATLSEAHQYTNRVTSFPIEDNTYISDHVINDPVTIQINGVVSDTPLNIFTAFNRSVDSFNQLVRLVETKARITVVTGIKVYTDMVITSLNVPRNVTTGQSLTFNIELQKLKIDASVRLILNQNNPFNKPDDKIPREIVAEADKYPFIQADPVTSLKDQASSGVDIGIQDLLPVPLIILPRIIGTALTLRGLF